MFSEMKILVIAEFFILNHVSYVLSRRLNLTQLIKENLDPELYQNALREISSKRDVPYLPEEYYNAENGVNKLQRLGRDNRYLITEYRSLCEIITRMVEIADSDYEYQPPIYHEVYCKSYSLQDNNEQTMTRPSQQECVYPIFHCVQRTRILSFVRRRWGDECWEPYTKEIASGCDCMWPVASLGEINHHY
ncbi:uncharacterized protein LOC114938889 [Nylanderia fulva]|uniref:uncharacterized protein LOC114938889 n=1 Tax=Nylanderia fulva TaxID=613905 RepID=UPI0010FB512E|nr:uncharacterized protein LOC114938889 [Nylanderia fulva]XP_029168847.1 uncharacterized protein LOC114938889 [Nylanderia fulva]XP_029168848.1 uncharacterized protein LOC114938889 [Nylanderia fulva]